MAHAIWKGHISFGLVNIPVGLYAAEKRDDLNFNLLDKNDLSPIGYKKVSKLTGREVQTSEMVKGYEYQDGRYVVLTDEDFKRANVKATQSVDIIDFVDEKDIHPAYFDRPYYLAPVSRGEKSYALLREALKKTGRAGIAKVVIHSREYLAVLLPYGDVLELNLLRYAYELRDTGELAVPGRDLKKLGVTDKELDMATKLIEGMAGSWDPQKYHDTYREDLLSYINKKIESGETEKIVEPPAEKEAPGRAEVIDLMSLLKKSVERAERERTRVKKIAGR